MNSTILREYSIPTEEVPRLIQSLMLGEGVDWYIGLLARLQVRKALARC
jgi:hypothetical protein